jgi:hypothetical protein
MTARSKRITVANLLGLPIKSYGDTANWGFYDGKLLHISSSLSLMDIDHEIGHFLAASLKQRKTHEFGLGKGPAYPDHEIAEKFKLPIKVINNRGREFEESAGRKESMASLFGIAVTYVFDKKDEWRNHASSHNWDDAATACDLQCLIRPTEHFNLKNRLAQVLAQLNQIKARL